MKIPENNFEINGLKLIHKNTSNKKYRSVIYKTFLCKIVIASDDMGTQICYNGRFFGPLNLKNIEEGVEYLRKNKKHAIKFFRKVYLHSLKYTFSKANFRHLYWKIRHHFDPNFYFGDRK